MANFPKLISVDDHVIEHANVWQDRLPAKYRDVGPRVVQERGHMQFVGGVFSYEPADDGGAPSSGAVPLAMFDAVVADALARREEGRAPDYASQSLYEEFLRTLEERNLSPGTVVIDDKWQRTYGQNEADPDKWPNLPGFVAAQHAAGRRVLLWLKAWDPEGVPAGECITNAGGLPIAVDPTNPAFEARLRAAVRRMLSPGGYDADGFKIDFTARIPSGPAIRLHGDLWGLELMKHYLWIIHDEAKATKPDALIIAHTTHPYLAGVVDMIRLNDINVDRNVLAAMTHRARVARIACPEALIDADNWPIPDLATWREYVRLQPALGVPSLYYASHIDATQEPLEAEDYRLVEEIWAQYRVRLAPGPGQGHTRAEL